MRSSCCSVDTLLQIHAIHNLLDIFEIQGVEMEKESYQQDLVKLESKYMKSYADVVSVSFFFGFLRVHSLFYYFIGNQS